MLALAAQGTAALMQRLRPAHYHQPLSSQSGVDHAAGHARDDMAVQTTMRWPHFGHAPPRHAWFPGFGRSDHAHEGSDRRHAHEHAAAHPRAAGIAEQSTDPVDAHRHAGIGHHRHAPEDRGVVYLEGAELNPALAAVINYGSDGFVLALPSWWRLVDARDADDWLPVIARGYPSYHTGAPERPPRSLRPLPTPRDRTRWPAYA